MYWYDTTQAEVVVWLLVAPYSHWIS